MSYDFDPFDVNETVGWTPDEWSIGFSDPREGEARTHMIVVIPDETGWDGVFFQLSPRRDGSRVDIVEWAVQMSKDVFEATYLDAGYRYPVDGEKLEEILGFSVEAAIALSVFERWRLMDVERGVDRVFRFAGPDPEGGDASVVITVPASGWMKGRIDIRQEYGMVPLDVLAWILVVARDAFARSEK